MPIPDQIDQEMLDVVQKFTSSKRELHIPLQFIIQHAPAPLKTAILLQSVFLEQDCVVRLLDALSTHIPPEALVPTTEEANSKQCDVWSFFGVLLLLQGKAFQALEVFNALYKRMLTHQTVAGNRFHKGLPLFHISQSYQALAYNVHAKRYMMMVLCEDAVTGGGTLNLGNTGSYGSLAWHYGLTHQQIQDYAQQAHTNYQSHPTEGAMPEWLLQRVDQHWKTEIPSAQEAWAYHITQPYCEFLLNRLGTGDGKDLETLAEYLVGAMPGCRTHRRARTHSTDFDVVGSFEGPIADFRSELGRYFACECKDKAEDKVSFTEVAKFCRVLDSVKAKLGIIFSPTGHSGAGQTQNADREILKVYQNRGIVIVLVDRSDLRRVADGMNFVSMLREKYELVRLDLRGN